ncbi:hypothetical protein D5S19_07570 [Amycolatopsis panacis]|uniref:Uncharacterized protein n=1 Tax=Amycolatopsis panacis TaxID=2340917 RepID=A0A419I7V6_9PSEU|nr:hypothetical protein D5S19_07570 [Amycolatopsis panacis]
MVNGAVVADGTASAAASIAAPSRIGAFTISPFVAWNTECGRGPPGRRDADGAGERAWHGR